MKIRINDRPDIQEIEVIINCVADDPLVNKIISALNTVDAKLLCRRQGETFQLGLADILYIESVDRKTFLYTEEQVYETDRRLYELEDYAEQKLKGFSGGMLRRVGIAQTLLCNPQILLLDEPTAGLDPQERVRLRNLLSALAQHSIIILSTHIVSDVELIAEKIILLREGQIAAFDTVAGLVGKSTLEDVYLTYFQKEA